MSLLSVPLNVHILDALGEEEAVALTDLNRAVGHPPATTMRSYLKGLGDLGVAERRQEGGFPGTVAYSLTPAGERFLDVAASLQSWLKDAPDEPIGLGTPAAKSAIKALVEGWNATLLRVLAARPLALTELAKLITSISYPTLERRLTAMRRAGQVQGRRNGSGSRGTPYEATAWLRQAAAPLISAVAWERECAPAQTRVLTRIDIEALFLLAIPALELPEELSGSCRLAVEIRSSPQPEFAGAMVRLEAGRPVSSVSRLAGDSDAWITGSTTSWLNRLSNRRDCTLDIGGNSAIARAVLETLGRSLLPRPSVKA